jgi:hypothetical protein
MLSRFKILGFLLVIASVSACAQPARLSSPHPGGNRSPLLEPLERARKAAAEVEANQLQQQKAVLEAGQ